MSADITSALSTDLKKLESLFSTLNHYFYKGKLQKPVITIMTNSRRVSAHGWCTEKKMWQNTSIPADSKLSNGGYYEINICAESLNRPFLDVCETLLHEMVHLYNNQHNIKDTSRSGLYHNKCFKKAAEDHGLYVIKDDRYGFCHTGLNTEGYSFVNSLDKMQFQLYRKCVNNKSIDDAISSAVPKAEKKYRPKTKYAYICPRCKLIAYTVVPVRISCLECNVPLESEREKGEKLISLLTSSFR